MNLLLTKSIKSYAGYTLSAGQCTLTICTAGSYHTDSGCKFCESGYMSDSDGAASCRQCDSGTYSNALSGSTACLDCSPKSWSRAGASTCISCTSDCDPKSGIIIGGW